MAIDRLELLEAALEAPIYEDQGRRSHRRQSPRDRRIAAVTAQAMSGVRIRVARPVKNQSAFGPELKAWIPFVQTGVAARKSLGNLAMTIFDTNQQPLMCSEGQTQESIEEKLQRACPALFRPSPKIEVTGTDLFGSRSRPFIGLTLAPGTSHLERQQVRECIAPELMLGDDHQLDHRLHISLGQAYTRDHALVIQKALNSVLPEYVQFNPATILVEADRAA